MYVRITYLGKKRGKYWPISSCPPLIKGHSTGVDSLVQYESESEKPQDRKQGGFSVGLCTMTEAWSGLATTAVAGIRGGAKNLCSNAQEVSFTPNFSSAVENESDSASCSVVSDSL